MDLCRREVHSSESLEPVQRWGRGFQPDFTSNYELLN